MLAGLILDLDPEPDPAPVRRVLPPRTLPSLGDAAATLSGLGAAKLPSRPVVPPIVQTSASPSTVAHPPAPAPTSESAPRVPNPEALHRLRMAGHAVVAAQRFQVMGKERARREMEAERLRQEREQADFLTRLGVLAEALGDVDPKWGVKVASLDKADLRRMATTGRWVTLSSKVTLDWKGSAKREAATKAAETAKLLKTEADKLRPTLDATPGTDQETAGVIQRLLVSAAPDISLPDLAGLSALATEILGEQVVSAIASSVPFLSTITGVAKATWATQKAVRIELARSSAVDASVSLRPGTPALATSCIIEELAYLRNVQAGTAALNAAAAVASVFDLGGASGPAKSLAELAISVHGLYCAYTERRDFRDLVGGKPYDALKRSPTVSAFVLLHYPAIGLMDPTRPQQDVEEVVKRRLGFLWEYKEDARVIANYKALRGAAGWVLDGSRLEATA